MPAVIPCNSLGPIPARFDLIHAAVSVFHGTAVFFSERCSGSISHFLSRHQLSLCSEMLTGPVLQAFKQKTTNSHTQTREILAGSSEMLVQGHGICFSDSELLLASNSDSHLAEQLFCRRSKKNQIFFFYVLSKQLQDAAKELSRCQSQQSQPQPPKRAPKKP